MPFGICASTQLRNVSEIKVGKVRQYKTSKNGKSPFLFIDYLS